MERDVKRSAAVLGALIALASGGLASAHHSAAMFDASKTVTLKGVVKQFQWTNPHSWLIISVQNPDGRVVDWSVEMTSPNLLQRAGWRPSTIQVGDRITVVGAPLRDGSLGAQFQKATMGDGRTLTYESVAPNRPY